MQIIKQRAFGKVQQRELVSWWGSPDQVTGSEGDVEIKGDQNKRGLSVGSADQVLQTARCPSCQVGAVGSWLGSGCPSLRFICVALRWEPTFPQRFPHLSNKNNSPCPRKGWTTMSPQCLLAIIRERAMDWEVPSHLISTTENCPQFINRFLYFSCLINRAYKIHKMSFIPLNRLLLPWQRL